MTETGTAAAGGLAGKVALVVGGGWSGPDDYAIGIGGAICQHLAREAAKRNKTLSRLFHSLRFAAALWPGCACARGGVKVRRRNLNFHHLSIASTC